MVQPVSFKSPIGLLCIIASEKGITHITLTKKTLPMPQKISDDLKDSLIQLKKYFDGKSRTFSLKLSAEGTVFQKKVWAAASTIPYGKTATYSDIAKQIGKPNAVRAVGSALGKNPICIIVPCHRVLPKSGGIGEYALGASVKKWLLDFEQTLTP